VAVHVLAVLADKNGEPVSSTLLAASVNTNPVIIRRLLLDLQKAKLVETKKGAGFGSRLSRPAAKINLGEIFRAVEKHEPFILPHRKPNMACPVGCGIQHALEAVFISALRALERDLSRTTLAGILRSARRGGVSAREFAEKD